MLRFSISARHPPLLFKTTTVTDITRPVCKGGVTGVVTPLNLSEIKFSGSTFGSCTTVTAQFSSFVHQCGCSQL